MAEDEEPILAHPGSPEMAKHVDDLCFIKTLQTDQFNHGPAQLMVHTGQADGMVSGSVHSTCHAQGRRTLYRRR